MSLIDFGFQQVPASEKAKKVAAVFSSVAGQYDVMNDVMSLGMHRLWKNFTVNASQVRTGQQVLDIAGGTGDLAARFSERVGPEGRVYLADINADMLAVGRERLLDHGKTEIIYIQANAECLPFTDNQFDCISIAFGLRNVTDKAAALQSMY
ncbi:MAG: class I SAM-dependent methyltransferase, partial [Gammaproteobacteria bacterium]